MNTKHSSGQVLIEAIVAISIGVVGLLGFLQLLTQAVSINKDVGQKFVATYLAAEGIEIVKSLVDEDYVSGNGWGESLDGGNYEVSYDSTELGGSLSVGVRSIVRLRYDSASGLYNYDVGNPTSFVRTIELINIGTPDNELKVVSIVEWTARGEPEEVTLEGHFFCWRPDILCD